jgi:hypothetical protein
MITILCDDKDAPAREAIAQLLTAEQFAGSDVWPIRRDDTDFESVDLGWATEERLAEVRATLAFLVLPSGKRGWSDAVKREIRGHVQESYLEWDTARFMVPSGTLAARHESMRQQKADLAHDPYRVASAILAIQLALPEREAKRVIDCLWLHTGTSANFRKTVEGWSLKANVLPEVLATLSTLDRLNKHG